MSKCVRCRARKGKRSCPALGSGICSECCGRCRLRDISCPADCSYLQSSEKYQADRRVERVRRALDGMDTGIEADANVVAYAVESEIFRQSFVMEGLHDGLVRRAVLRARREISPIILRGVEIQEGIDGDDRETIEDLAREVITSVEEECDTELDDLEPLRLAFDRIVASIDLHSRGNPSGVGYLRFVVSFIGRMVHFRLEDRNGEVLVDSSVDRPLFEEEQARATADAPRIIVEGWS